MAKAKVSMTIDDRTLAEFKLYCHDNGMKISTKVEQLMRDLVKGSFAEPKIDKAKNEEKSKGKVAVIEGVSK